MQDAGMMDMSGSPITLLHQDHPPYHSVHLQGVKPNNGNFCVLKRFSQLTNRNRYLGHGCMHLQAGINSTWEGPDPMRPGQGGLERACKVQVGGRHGDSSAPGRCVAQERGRGRLFLAHACSMCRYTQDDIN